MSSKFSQILVCILTIFLALVSQNAFAAVTESVLYVFPISGNMGYFPQSALVYHDGRFFGTTNNGGGAQCNCGVVFSLAPASGGGWNYHVLHAFQGTNGDGYGPLGNLVFDAAGNLYGVTAEGGTNFTGTVFELSPNSGGPWTYKVLYSFGPNGGVDAIYPSDLTIDAAGNLYGPSAGGGAFLKGSIYRLSPGSDGTWSETILYSFAGLEDGSGPNPGLAFDAAGNLYGSTYLGIANSVGTVFELSPTSGGSWTLSTLFTATDTIGYPLNITRDAAGNLYGVSYPSGNANLGTAFEVSPNGDGTWSGKVLHAFLNVKAGQWPKGALLIDGHGNLYGTTEWGGTLGSGTVFKLTPGSSGSWGFSILHNFAGGPNDGGAPLVGLTMVKGTLFGNTVGGGTYSSNGVIFEIAP